MDSLSVTKSLDRATWKSNPLHGRPPSDAVRARREARVSALAGEAIPQGLSDNELRRSESQETLRSIASTPYRSPAHSGELSPSPTPMQTRRSAFAQSPARAMGRHSRAAILATGVKHVAAAAPSATTTRVSRVTSWAAKPKLGHPVSAKREYVPAQPGSVAYIDTKTGETVKKAMRKSWQTTTSSDELSPAKLGERQTSFVKRARRKARDVVNKVLLRKASSVKPEAISSEVFRKEGIRGHINPLHGGRGKEVEGKSLLADSQVEVKYGERANRAIGQFREAYEKNSSGRPLLPHLLLSAKISIEKVMRAGDVKVAVVECEGRIDFVVIQAPGKRLDKSAKKTIDTEKKELAKLGFTLGVNDSLKYKTVLGNVGRFFKAVAPVAAKGAGLAVIAF